MQKVNSNNSDNSSPIPCPQGRLDLQFERKNKKILFVITQSEMGGAQRYVLNTSLYLAKKGWDVMAAAGEGDGALISKIKNQKSKIKIKNQRLKHLKRMPGPMRAWLSVREIKKLLQKEQPDVLFLCSTMAGILGSIAARKCKMFQVSRSLKRAASRPCAAGTFRVLYRIGGWAFRDPRPFWQKKLILFLEKWTAKYKDKIIVNSQLDFDLALRYKIASPEKLIKIYNGIEPTALNFLPKDKAREVLMLNIKCQMPAPRRSGASASGPSQCQMSNAKIVGTIANLYKTKGLEYLIEAAHLLRSTFHVPRFTFVIIGDGPERNNLKSKIGNLKLENTIFLLGKISDAQRYLKAFDIFVLPSLKEGFPWVILEAMASELPIIATKAGAVQEILENKKSGLLLEPANSQALAEAIKKLLENPQIGKRLTQNVKSRLANFSEEKMLSQTEKIIS